MPTIKDIALAAGVSHATVSNVLNKKGNVSSEKIRHVMEVSEALGYVPNERAKMLRKGQANLLGVLLPDLHAKQYIDFFLSFVVIAGIGIILALFPYLNRLGAVDEKKLREGGH